MVLWPQLEPVPHNLHDYFREAASFMNIFRLVSAIARCDHHVAGVLANLDHGRPFVAAPPEPGSRYMFSTIRAHLDPKQA